jgi:hypothetical protein
VTLGWERLVRRGASSTGERGGHDPHDLEEGRP